MYDACLTVSLLKCMEWAIRRCLGSVSAEVSLGHLLVDSSPLLPMSGFCLRLLFGALWNVDSGSLLHIRFVIPKA